MSSAANGNDLSAMRSYYESGITKTYTFRKKQLQLLKEAVLKYEREIYNALYSDLKKSPEESYATESGLILADINVALNKLHKWMKPKRAGVDFVNLPSYGKIYRDPLGVVLIIAPWNYPLQLLFIPMIGAIAGGNCVMLKPSEFAPATAALAEKIIHEIFPKQYVQIVLGDGAELIPAMMQSFRFDHIFYTGSIPVGREIYKLAAKDIIPVTLELGGKSPCVIEADADIPSAARRIALGKFANAGQTCIAPDYVLVHRAVKEKFMLQFRETIDNFFGDNPEKSYSYGKIINQKRFEKLTSYLTQGDITIGGQTDKENLFIAPAVVENVSLDWQIMQEEIFGPVLPLLVFETSDEAFAIIQKNPNPLAFYLFTSNSNTEKEWIDRVAFGGGCINNTIWHFANHRFPFGGIGSSGIGAYHGKHSFDTFTHAKSVMKTPTWFDPAIKYPPFNNKLKWFKKFIG
jgi:aldehyde dehydrogenase (NAD+)